MRQRHAARGGLFQELAFLEPICSRNSTPPSITRPAAKSASSRAGADSSSGITRRSSAFARERKPMPAPSVHASMLSRVPAGTSAMSCLFLISHGTHSARSASSSFFAFCASSTRSTRPLPPPFRSAVVHSSRWRRRRPSGRHHPSPQTMQQVHLQHPSEGLCRKSVMPAILHLLQSVPDPQKRGPARAKRSGQTHETARSSWPFADSIEEVVSCGCPLSVEGSKTSIRRLFWNRTCLHYGAPLLWQPLPRVCRILPSWTKEPGSPESSGHGKSQAGPAGKAPPASRRCLYHSRPDGPEKTAYAGQFTHGKALQDPRRDLLSPTSRSAGARPSCAQSRPKHPFRLQCLSPDIAR